MLAVGHGAEEGVHRAGTGGHTDLDGPGHGVGPRTHEHDVVRAAGLRPQTHRGLLPAAEGLALHDRAGDPAVDVGVADAHLVSPLTHLRDIEGVDAAGQAEVGGVLQLDGLLQGVGAHEAEHRAEDLGEVEEGFRLHVRPDARGPQPTGVVELTRLHQPLLARLQGGQRTLQLVRGQLGQRSHRRPQVRRPVDDHRLRGVHQLAQEPLRLVDRADENAEGRRGALLPRMPERGLDQVGDGQVTVGRRGDDDGVLTRGLAVDLQAGTPGAEHRGGFRGTGEDHPVDALVGDEGPADGPLGGVHAAQQVTRHAGVPQCLEDLHGAVRGRLRRLVDHTGTGGERGEGAAGRDGQREVPRRGHQHDAVRGEGRVADLGQCLGAVRVVAGEVDRLGDLHVGLLDRLADLGSGDRDQVATAVREDVGGAVQDRGALTHRTPGPLLGRGGDRGHQRVDVGVLHGFRGGEGVEETLGGGVLDGGRRPRLVGGQRRVRVRLIGESGQRGVGVGRRGDVLQHLGATVLQVVRTGGGVAVVGEQHLQVGQRGAEPLLLAAEGRVARGDVEDAGHEVHRRRVLLQAPDQVGHRNVELLGTHRRDVEQQLADILAHGLGLVVGHALQHLELDPVGHAALDGEGVGEGDVEEVVAGDAEAQAAEVLATQRPVQDALVVGVRGLLRGAGDVRPALHLGVDGLHGEVRPLDQADLDPGATVGDALRAEGGELLERAEGVRQVGLQHDAGLEVLCLREAEQALEDVDGQAEVVVLLHVEVDELRALRRLRRLDVQRGEALDDVVDGLLVAPEVDLGRHGGRLDGDVVHVGAGDETSGLGEVVVGLLLTEHRLAEEVDVQALSAGGELGDGLAERPVVGVHDHVADHLADAGLGGGDDDLWNGRREC